MTTPEMTVDQRRFFWLYMGLCIGFSIGIIVGSVLA